MAWPIKNSQVFINNQGKSNSNNQINNKGRFLQIIGINKYIEIKREKIRVKSNLLVFLLPKDIFMANNEIFHDSHFTLIFFTLIWSLVQDQGPFCGSLNINNICAVKLCSVWFSKQCSMLCIMCSEYLRLYFAAWQLRLLITNLVVLYLWLCPKEKRLLDFLASNYLRTS